MTLMSKRAGASNGRHSAGLSLVELLIAMTIGLVLIAGMVAVFAGNRQSSELNSAMTNLQETARFALDNIARDIRKSGFQGCVDINSGAASVLAKTAPTGTTSTTDLRFTSAIGSRILTGNTWSPGGPPTFVTNDHVAVTGTHALTLQFGKQSTFKVLSEMSNGGIPDRAVPLDVEWGGTVKEFPLGIGDLAIASNCNVADLFRVSGVSAVTGGVSVSHGVANNTSPLFSDSYGRDGVLGTSMLMGFESNVYYVGDTGRENASGDPITALYLQTLPYNDTNPAVELVEGVENMRVAFGIRRPSGALQYVTPGSAGFNLQDVESVRIGLLMNSWDRIAQVDDQNTYILAGQAISAAASGANTSVDTHPTDRRFRLAFNTTVKIRNRRNNNS